MSNQLQVNEAVVKAQMEVRRVIFEHKLAEGVYAQFPEDALLVEKRELEGKIQNPHFPTVGKVAAASELLQVEGFVKLFNMMRAMGLPTKDMNGSAIVAAVLCETLESHTSKYSGVGAAAQVGVKRFKELGNTVKGSTNKWAKWLASKTE